MRKNRRKAFFAGMTALLCIAIMLSGTFAWQSISQYALNETMGEMLNPGGRLHDDFNGSNKDIYVENFTSAIDGMPIIVRIRLYEYMEIGANAGANLPDVSLWEPYIPGNERAEHCDYWDWTLGGKTVYMPTFDKNKDSDYSDINGTYEGTTEGDKVHFDDYQVYQTGDIVNDTASYDADDNHDYDSGITVAAEDHVAKETIAGTVISMAEWTANPVLGNYWVYDTDGWAYWANPLMPDTATGLLLSKIQLNQPMTQKWYYGIYVESQMVTADEVGSQTQKVGFYGPDAKKEPSDAARHLLDKLIEKIGYAPVSGAFIEEERDEVMLSDLEITEQGLTVVSKSKQNRMEEKNESKEAEESINKDEIDGQESKDKIEKDITLSGETEDKGKESDISQDSNMGESGNPTENDLEDGPELNTANPTDIPTEPEQSENPNSDELINETNTPVENSEEEKTLENEDITSQEPSADELINETNTPVENSEEEKTLENEDITSQEPSAESTGILEKLKELL